MANSHVSKKNGPKVSAQAAAPKEKLAKPQFTTDADRSMRELFISELKDIYWAENHLTKALPKMIAAANDKTLKKALTDHLSETVNQLSRLEEIFSGIDEKNLPKKCDAMEGLTMSGEHIIENTVAGTPTRDLGLTMAGLKVENFEITTYNGMIQVATALGLSNAVDLLQQNLDEEIAASEKLSQFSQQSTAA